MFCFFTITVIFILLLIIVIFFLFIPSSFFYTLSLHDALPIFGVPARRGRPGPVPLGGQPGLGPLALEPVAEVPAEEGDRKSTRLNSSHLVISYAVFCLINNDASDILIGHSLLQ